MRLLTSITSFLVFLFTLFIAQPLLDQTQGNLYGVVASAWLVVALPSVAALLANIYGCNLIKKSAKAKSVPMAVILVTTGVLLAWLVLCVLRAANWRCGYVDGILDGNPGACGRSELACCVCCSF